MRVVFAGTPEIAVPSLRALLAAEHELAGVVSQPDRPRGRGRKLAPSPVSEVALAENLPLVRPERAKSPELLSALREWRPDCLLVIAFGLILTEETLAVPRVAPLNAHASLLPKFRGPAPVPRAILAGEEETGVSIMRITRRLDHGPVLLQSKVPIRADDTAETLALKLAELSGTAFLEALELLESGGAEFEEQDEAKASRAPKLVKEDGRIDWRQDAAALDRHTRAMDPWPGAFTFLPVGGGGGDGEVPFGLRLKILKLRAAPAGSGGARVPGSVIEDSGEARERLLVACGRNGAEAVELLRLQAEGGKPLEAEAFLRGRKIGPGTRLG